VAKEIPNTAAGMPTSDGGHFEIESLRKSIDRRFYTLKEVADLLRVHYMTVYRLVIVGEIDATKVAGVWRIPAESLIDYLESRHPFNFE